MTRDPNLDHVLDTLIAYLEALLVSPGCPHAEVTL
ncbi:MAG: hypothetical protein JWQ77_2295 [Jatrophihabitans sp.]|nr:hypothetical protein [Jatrophihabitans sp.]